MACTMVKLCMWNTIPKMKTRSFPSQPPRNLHRPMTNTHTCLKRWNRSTSWSSLIATVRTWTARNCNTQLTFTTNVKDQKQRPESLPRNLTRMKAISLHLRSLLSPSPPKYNLLTLNDATLYILRLKKNRRSRKLHQLQKRSLVYSSMIDDIAIDQVAGFFFLQRLGICPS
jgi:hypothetical protein